MLGVSPKELVSECSSTFKTPSFSLRIDDEIINLKMLYIKHTEENYLSYIQNIHTKIISLTFKTLST